MPFSEHERDILRQMEQPLQEDVPLSVASFAVRRPSRGLPAQSRHNRRTPLP